MKGPSLPPPRCETLNWALAEAATSPAGITVLDLHERETSLPFVEIRRRARLSAGALRARGVRPGDRVAIVLPTSPAFFDAFFGTLLAAAVPVPLYPPVRLGRLDEYHASTARMIAAVGAALVVTDRRSGGLLGTVIERARPRLGRVTADGLAGDRSEAAELDVDPDSLALIQFSSGATTAPKPVALTHRQLMAQLSAIRGVLPPEDGDPQLGVSWLPLYHDMGLIGCLLLAVYYPGPLVLIPPELFLARPALWLRAIARHRATVSLAPAFGYAYAAQRVRDEELAGVDLSSWRLAGCGAEPIPLEALDAFARRYAARGFDARALRPCYGLAEACLALTFTPPGRPVVSLSVDPAHLAATGEVSPGPRPVVSVGAPVAGVEIEVRDDRGRPLPEGRVGRIVARGGSIMEGYFGRRRLTDQTLDGGWLATGDLGFVAGGELFVCGREKDVIVIRGANHAPQEFEECVAGLAGIRRGGVAALGFLPEGADGERLLVLAERSRGVAGDGRDGATVEGIRRGILEGTGIEAHTVLLLEPGTLPRTSSGKLRRHEALRRFLAGRLDPPARVGAFRLSLEVARSSLAYLRARFGGG